MKPAPAAIRQASRNIRAKYHPALDIEPIDHDNDNDEIISLAACDSFK